MTTKRIGQVLAVTGSQLTVEVNSEISDLHIRHDGKTYTVGQPGAYLIVEGGHDKHLVLITTVRKSPWAPPKIPVDLGNSASSTPHFPEGNFPYLPPSDLQMDRTLIDGVLLGTITGRSFDVGVTRLPVVGDPVTLPLKATLKSPCLLLQGGLSFLLEHM